MVVGVIFMPSARSRSAACSGVIVNASIALSPLLCILLADGLFKKSHLQLNADNSVGVGFFNFPDHSKDFLDGISALCHNDKLDLLFEQIGHLLSYALSCFALRLRSIGDILVRKGGIFMRKRIFEIIELAGEQDRASKVYDYTMMVAILFSLIPLAFKETTTLFSIMDKSTAALFIIDYLARMVTADLSLQRGKLSFVLYPITPMAIVDLLAILPSIFALSAGLKLFKIFRLARSFRVFRVFKMLRYSKSIMIIQKVIREQRAPLLAVGTLAVAYILISALIIFNVEPNTFDTFFDAVYWATISLTTMGYGDIYPVTTAGRIVTMLSSFVGIAIVALPSGIITAGYMSEIDKDGKRDE